MYNSTLLYALLPGLSLTTMAVGFKLAAPGIQPALGTAIVTGIAFVVNMAVVLWARTMGTPMAVSKSSVYLLVGVGVATACVNLFTMLAYASGLKVTSSVVIGGTSTALIMLVGFLLLGEPFSWPRLVAIGLIASGVFVLQRAGM